MSGHSKWHKIRHKKSKEDQKRGKIFTKAAKAISVAAREGGGDPEMNFSLRIAIDKAKSLNVPKDNIERAVKRGTGELQDGEMVEEIVYEAFGPGGVAFIIDTLTDNRNRTVAELKHLFSKNDGSIGEPGSVKWQFERKGVARVAAEEKQKVEDWDSLQLSLMDAGAQEMNEYEEGVEIICSIHDFQNVVDVLDNTKIKIADSGLEWIPKEEIDVDGRTKERVEQLIDKVEDHDDVRDVYTNEK